MAATTSGTKTVTHSIAPHLTAAMLTTLLATPLENLTVWQLSEICDALKRTPGRRYFGADGWIPAHLTAIVTPVCEGTPAIVTITGSAAPGMTLGGTIALI